MAVGPKASQDLSREEVKQAVSDMMAGSVEPVTAAVFLLGLRLKRETQAENEGVLDGLQRHTRTWKAPIPRILDVADPYDGFRRIPHWSLFRAAILASMGLPTVLHGSTLVPPKNGVTTLDLIRQWSGLPEYRVPHSRTEQTLLECGWTFCDLQAFCPPLEALRELREQMVKRTCLATVEKLLLPIRGEVATVCVSGYVHSGYGEAVSGLLSVQGAEAGWVFRGPEGHASLHGSKKTEVLGFGNGTPTYQTREFPATGFTWNKSVPVTAESVLKAGMDALQHEEYASLRSHLASEAAAHALLAGHVSSIEEGLKQANIVIGDGSAEQCLKRGLSLLTEGGT